MGTIVKLADKLLRHSVVLYEQSASLLFCWNRLGGWHLDIEESYAGTRVVDLCSKLLPFLQVRAAHCRQVNDGNVVEVSLDDLLLDQNIAEARLQNGSHGVVRGL